MTEEEQIVEDARLKSIADSKVDITQSKLDELIGAGFGKGASKAEKAIYEQLGINDAEGIKDIKAAMDAKKSADDADKSELEKALTTIETLNGTIGTLETSVKKQDDSIKLTKVAMDNGVSDVDYFGHVLNQAKSQDDFEMDKFVKDLKEAKPYIFNGKVKPVDTDDSSNTDGEPDDKLAQIQKMPVGREKKKALDAYWATLK